MMMQKYGQPDEITAMRLVWRDNGPWKRTYAQAIENLMAGKKDPYVQGLQFAAHRSAADKDKPVMKQAKAD